MPRELKNRLSKGILKGIKFSPKIQFKGSQGKWPQFAVAVTQFAARHDVQMPHELWPLATYREMLFIK